MRDTMADIGKNIYAVSVHVLAVAGLLLVYGTWTSQLCSPWWAQHMHLPFGIK